MNKDTEVLAQDLKDSLSRQLQSWTVVGPIGSDCGREDGFSPLALDAARQVPQSFEYKGRALAIQKITIAGRRVDFRELFGLLPGRPQAYAFCELDVDADCEATITYDADWQALWWLDGQEVHCTRDGNYGAVGQMHHPIRVGLSRGRHLLGVRVISGMLGWAVIAELAGARPGIRGLLDTSRGAPWRDYTKAVVRYENRPAPDGSDLGFPRDNYERVLASLGVEARWISVVEKCQGAHYPSKFLPAWSGARPEYERQLKEWVEILHRNRLAAISWYPLCYCLSAAHEHPDWRQQFLVAPDSTHNHWHFACCINSPYGQAAIDFVIESLLKFDLDGMYFDGAAFTPIWERPQPVSCVCPHCREKFKADTGLDLPSAYDWSRPVFRRWIQWRYDMFSDYWQRMTDAVHAVMPQATLVFNHYHRERIGWCGAVPLTPFGHDFVAGTEADAEPLRGMFYTRLARAFGRKHTEVWMHVAPHGRNYTPRGLELDAAPVLEFAAACSTAGGHMATGGGEMGAEIPVLASVAGELAPRKPYLGLPSLPYAALHVSQQSETFVFGRNPGYLAVDWIDYYWNSLTGWHHAMAFAGKFCDVIFDSRLTAGRLGKYPVLVMPQAQALAPSQLAAVMTYVRRGGSLVCGPWLGVCDEWGEPRPQALGDRELFPFGETLFGWDEIADRPALKIAAPAKSGRIQHVSARPLACLPPDVGSTISLSWGKANPIIRRSRLGRGQVIQLAVDLGTLMRYSPWAWAVQAVADLFDFLPRPPVEVSAEGPVLMGAFTKGKDVVVSLQRFSPPWEKAQAAVMISSGMGLIWRGRKPRQARCALPRLGVPLKIARKGQAWLIQVPSFDRGQTVVLEGVTPS